MPRSRAPAPVRRPRPSPAAAGLLVVAAALALLVGRPVAEAADTRLDALLAAYATTSARHDDAAYASARTTLTAVADLDTAGARRALHALVVSERDGREPCDPRRMALLLEALVRRGAATDVAFAIDAADAPRCRGVEASLPRILGAAVGEAARAYVRDVALVKGRSSVRACAARALGGTGGREAVLPLLLVLRDDNVVVRAEALLALGALGDASALPGIAVFLSGPDPRLREVAARALGALGSERAVPALVRALDDAVARVAESAATSLSILAPAGVAVSVPAILARWGGARAPDARLGEAFERALSRITGVDVGGDVELWTSWWAANKDRPPTEVSRRTAPTTVSGARYYGFAVRSSRVAFVLDVSRSMSWNGRLDGARKELVQALASLPAGTKFTVIPFSDEPAPWSERLVPATADAVRRATRFVERLEPLSGTNSFAALRAALADDEVDSIWFLSDGSPSVGSVVDPDEILSAVAELNRWRRVRIHAVALLAGEPPAPFAEREDPVRAERFMRRLAEENDGRIVVIR